MTRALGVLLFVASLALPVHGCSRHPRDFEPTRRARPAADPRPVRAGWERVVARVEAGWERGGLRGALWDTRAWYPYFLAPFWLAALGLSSLGPRAARAATRALLGLGVGVAAFEACYLASDYEGFLPGRLQAVETFAAWAVVCAVLFWRPLRRRPDVAGAAVSAQALLGVLHALTFPVQDVRLWSAAGHGAGAIARALAANYRAGFWLAVAGLALAAAPGYLPLLAGRRSWRGPRVRPEREPASAGFPDAEAAPAAER